MAERNLLQKMFGVEGDGVSVQTKAGIKKAVEGTEDAPPPPSAGKPIMGSTTDPKATVRLEDGRRITPESNAILEQMLRQRQARMKATGAP
jgi:hypothetical protein